MNYQSIWKTLKETLDAHIRLAEEFKKSKDYTAIKSSMNSRIDYIETLKKLMDDLENNMLGLELNDMEREHKGGMKENAGI
jgi:hypothetical protein